MYSHAYIHTPLLFLCKIISTILYLIAFGFSFGFSNLLTLLTVILLFRLSRLPFFYFVTFYRFFPDSPCHLLKTHKVPTLSVMAQHGFQWETSRSLCRYKGHVWMIFHYTNTYLYKYYIPCSLIDSPILRSERLISVENQMPLWPSYWKWVK